MTTLTFVLDIIKIIITTCLAFSKPFLTKPVVYSVTAFVILINIIVDVQLTIQNSLKNLCDI